MHRRQLVWETRRGSLEVLSSGTPLKFLQIIYVLNNKNIDIKKEGGGYRWNFSHFMMLGKARSLQE